MMPVSSKKTTITHYNAKGIVLVKRLPLIIIFVLIILFLPFALAHFKGKNEFTPIKEQIENFKGIDSDQDSLSFDLLKGKMTLVVFGASWCGPCNNSIYPLNNLHKKNQAKGFQILYISCDESIKKMAAFKRRYDMPYPMILINEDISNKFGFTGQIPSYFFLDSMGRVYDRQTSRFSEPEFQKKINQKL